MTENIIIFLNGDLPDSKIINKLLNKSSFLISADGASNKLEILSITPDLIIGDLDSIKPVTLSNYKEKSVDILHIIDQETTDFEKCLIYCNENNLKDIIVFGATDMRPDHSLNNFSILKRYYHSLNIKLIDNFFETFFIRDKIEFECQENEIVSILALSIAEGVTTKGLMYPLNNERLEFGVREGTLNRSVSKIVSISFESGDLLLIKNHNI